MEFSTFSVRFIIGIVVNPGFGYEQGVCEAIRLCFDLHHTLFQMSHYFERPTPTLDTAAAETDGHLYGVHGQDQFIEGVESRI
jgi:hypothetical protein